MKGKKKNKLLISAIGLLLILTGMPIKANAAPPNINYQGYLTDNGGNPVNVPKNMQFEIWCEL